MSELLDLSTDWQVFDGLQTVTLSLATDHKTGPDPAGLLQFGQEDEFVDTYECRVAGVLKRNVSTREASASGGAYLSSDVNFWVPVGNLPKTIQPRPGDLIEEHKIDTVWTIQNVEYNVLRNAFRCVSRNLSLNADLVDIINIERPTISFDAAGAAVKAFPTGPAGAPLGGKYAYRNLAARVQLLTEEIVDERGVRGFKGTHAVIVSKQVKVTNEDRIAFAGRYYEIRGVHDMRKIDALPVLDCDLVP